MIEMRDNGPEAAAIHEQADASTHRSVYLPLLRGVDAAVAGVVRPRRADAGHRQPRHDHGARQALYLLNAPFVRRQSLALAERLLAEKATRRRRPRSSRPTG